MGKNRNGAKSVATMWAEMVAAAEAGEIVGIEDRHGNVVAVMVGVHQWNAMEERVRELEKAEEQRSGDEGHGGRG